MATVTVTAAPTTESPPASTVEGDQHVVIYNLGWDGYEEMLRILDGHSRPQMVYLDGNLHLMVTSSIHERRTDRLGTLVRVVVEELDIPCEPTRETTFRRRDLEAGVQPDDSFYLANHAVMAAKDGKEDVDLNLDPPPDLVIEVVHKHKADHAVEVLRRLGVAEVWVGDGDGLRILVLGPDGRYARSETSLAFPFLTAAEIFGWADRTGMASATQWIKELRRWVQETLLPRARGPIQP